MNKTYKLSNLLDSDNKIEQIKTNLNAQKLLIVHDFSRVIDEIKTVFELKLNDFLSSFNQELISLEKTIELITKNQQNFPKILQNLTNIMNDFERMSTLLQENKEKKPQNQRYLSVHFDKKTMQSFTNTNKNASPNTNTHINIKINTKISPFSNNTENPIDELNSFEKHQQFENATIINTPSLLPLKLTEILDPLENDENSIKLNNNLEDLQRKSLIISYEELVKRPRSISKNIRPETFVKIYLEGLYKKSKELYNEMDSVIIEDFMRKLKF